MAGTVSREELASALGLSEHIKEMLFSYELSHWAANLKSNDVKVKWSGFLSRLDVMVKKGKVNDTLVLHLIHYLSTLDSASLLGKIGEMNRDRQVRFLVLLNWVATEGPDQSQRNNANSVCERILMAYRMDTFPEVYSEERITRAIQIADSQK